MEPDTSWHIKVEGSSNVASYGYDEPGRSLEVRYKSGALWEYHKVPPDKFKGLNEAQSKGRYVASAIIPDYTGIRLYPLPPDKPAA